MSTEFGFIGWMEDKEKNHDKIWGYFLRPTPLTAQQELDKARGYTWKLPTKITGWNCVRFWGRRGKPMQFKADVTGHELEKVMDTKLNKGYERISPLQLDNIWPTFDEEMKLKLSFEVLVGNVK